MMLLHTHICLAVMEASTNQNAQSCVKGATCGLHGGVQRGGHVKFKRTVQRPSFYNIDPYVECL